MPQSIYENGGIIGKTLDFRSTVTYPNGNFQNSGIWNLSAVLEALSAPLPPANLTWSNQTLSESLFVRAAAYKDHGGRNYFVVGMKGIAASPTATRLSAVGMPQSAKERASRRSLSLGAR